MIRAEQIPDEVARLADEVYYDIAGDNPTMSDEDIMKHAIASALNAWPGSYSLAENDSAEIRGVAAIIIPLPQEARDE